MRKASYPYAGANTALFSSATRGRQWLRRTAAPDVRTCSRQLTSKRSPTSSATSCTWPALCLILDESRCQPTCPRTTICARRPPLGCARAPTCIEFEEGRCVVLESDVVEGGGGSGWSQGMPDLPLVVSLEFQYMY